MRRAYFISIILCIFLVGSMGFCVPSEGRTRSSVKATLSHAEKLLGNNADSALAILEAMDKSLLRTESRRSEYILLHALSLESIYGGFMNEDESLLSQASEYYEKKGSKEKASRIWYLLGKTQLAKGNLNAAVVSFTKAERSTTDDLQLAYIYRDLARAYNSSLNNVEEVHYMRLASECFAKAGMIAESGLALLETGKAYYNLSDYDNAEKIYQSVLYTSHQNRDTLLECKTLSAYASLSLAKEEQDPVLSINMLARAAENLGYNLSSLDKANLAYAYSLLDRRSQSERWLKDAKASFEGEAEGNTVRFREYQILSREGKYREALLALEDVMEYNTRTESGAFVQSALASQKDFFEQETSSSQEKLRSARLRFFILVLFVFVGLVIAYNFYRLQKSSNERRLAEERGRNEELMSIAEDLRSRLSEAEKQSTDSLSDSFNVLERLCEQYYVYEGTDNFQPKILKEVGSVVEGLRQDSSQIEGILNKRRDNLMAKFRIQYPGMKEDDVRLFCFTAAGLSSSTISTLMGKDKQYIYNRLYRLKGRIASSVAPDKDTFLQALGK